MIRFLASGFVLLATMGFLPAVSPDPSTLHVSAEEMQRARVLVQQLADASFRVRDKASRELEQMGRRAVAALIEGQNHPDPEVRLRSSLLLPRAEADDMKARVDAFLADAKSEYQHDLPGWQKFRRVAGDSRPARDLFVEIVKNRDNHELLLAIRGLSGTMLTSLGALTGGICEASPEQPTPTELAQALVARRSEMQIRISPQFPVQNFTPIMPTGADVALLLLAESLISENLAPIQGYQYHVINFLYQGMQPGQPNYELIQGTGKQGTAFRQLLLNWMETRDGLTGLSNATNLIQNLKLGDEIGAKMASRLLSVSGAQAWNKAQAANLLVYFKGRSYFPELSKHFDDETLLMRGGPGNPNPDIMVKDTMLAAACILSGQNPADYGMDVRNSPGTNSRTAFNYSFYRFIQDSKSSAEEKRAKAFQQWSNWERDQIATVAGLAPAVHRVATKFPAKAKAE
jgi:hypothetical protein